MVGFLTSGCRNNHQEKFQTQEIQGTEVPSITLSIPETTMVAGVVKLTLTPTVLPSRTPTLIVPTPTETPQKIPLENPLMWIVYDENGPSREIRIVKMDGTGNRVILGDIGEVYSVDWSPDGDWIAFTSGPTYGGYTQIYLIRPDGSDRRRLTYSNSSKTQMDWSPDGRSIVFLQESYPLNTLNVYEFDGPRIRQLTDATDSKKTREISPIYSPLGDLIAFVEISYGAGSTITSRLMIMDADGSNRRQFMETPLQVGNSLDWSPDGKQILFSGAENYNHCHDLYLFDIDTEEVTPFVIDDYHHIWQPKWSPDGNWVSYMEVYCNDNIAKTRGAQVYFRTVDTGTEIATRMSLPYPSFLDSYDLSPWKALKENRKYLITELGNNLRLRSTPALSGETLTWLKQGEHIIVLDGPEEADEYLWWYVQVVESGKEGWVADNPGWYEAE